MNRALLTLVTGVTLINATPDPAAAQPNAPAGTFAWSTYAGEAGTRRYKLFVSAGLDSARPAPLVVMLHGCTQDPDDFARGTRFNQAAAASGVLVAYPEQTGANHPQKCWTWYDPAHQGRGGEPAIIAGITREVMARHAVDSARVFVVGVSAGGIMAANVAAAYPELYGGVGVHSGTAYRGATDVLRALAVMKQGPGPAAELAEVLTTALGSGRRPAPLIVFHGAADAVVVPENGRALAAQWAAAAGQAVSESERLSAGGYRIDWSAYGRDVELWVVDGLGHAWSGGSPDGTYTDPRGPDASREILRFLLTHVR